MQMILCVVIDAEGRPICTEMWPGNTADVSVLLPVVDRLRRRFGIGRVCVVADRGMISAATIAGLEERGLEYVLGARERTDSLVREVVLADERPFTPLLVTARRRRRRPSSSPRRSRSPAGATSSAATRPRPRRTAPTARPSSPRSSSSCSAATRR